MEPLDDAPRVAEALVTGGRHVWSSSDLVSRKTVFDRQSNVGKSGLHPPAQQIHTSLLKQQVDMKDRITTVTRNAKPLFRRNRRLLN